MGNGNSLPQLPSYQEASARIGSKDTGKVAERFKHLTKEMSLKQSDFENMFTENLEFAELLFKSFCRYAESNKFRDFNEGVTFQEFFRRYATAIKGSEEERFSYCYILCDKDGDGWLTLDEFKNSMKVICNAAWDVQLPLLYSFSRDHPLPPKKDDYFELVDRILLQFLTTIKSQKISFQQFRIFLASYPQIRMFLEFALLSTFGGKEEMQDELKHYQAVSAPLMIGGDSNILTNEEHILLLRCWLPEPLCKYNWFKVYSTTTNGFALGTLYNMFAAKPAEIKSNASLLIIKDDHDHVFGVFTPDLYRKNNDRFYGSEETFLFSLYPNIGTYRCSGDNTNIIFSNINTLSFGGTMNHFAISLDSEFYHGTTASSSTFKNPQLSFSPQFNCKSLELWSFIDHENTNKLLGISSDDEEADDDDFNSAFKKKKKGKTAVERYKDKVYVLDMIDKHYSANLEPPPTFDDSDKTKPKISVLPSHGNIPTTFHKPKPYDI